MLYSRVSTILLRRPPPKGSEAKPKRKPAFYIPPPPLTSHSKRIKILCRDIFMIFDGHARKYVKITFIHGSSFMFPPLLRNSNSGLIQSLVRTQLAITTLHCAPVPQFAPLWEKIFIVMLMMVSLFCSLWIIALDC